MKCIDKKLYRWYNVITKKGKGNTNMMKNYETYTEKDWDEMYAAYLEDKEMSEEEIERLAEEAYYEKLMEMGLPYC